MESLVWLHFVDLKSDLSQPTRSGNSERITKSVLAFFLDFSSSFPAYPISFLFYPVHLLPPHIRRIPPRKSKFTTNSDILMFWTVSWRVLVPCMSFCFSARSSCGCSSGSRTSCGGWRRSWPPRTCEYASWNWSSTTWRTLAPTTCDLSASWTGKAASFAPSSDLQ